jgi:transglutaminase-like putative cysteine protease
VELGGHGVIKDDPTVVMRVKVPKAFRGREAPALHWRGTAYDHYQGGRWAHSRSAPRTEVSLDSDQEAHRTWVHFRYDVMGEYTREELAARLGHGMRQEIYLEPLGGTSVLFAAAMPTVFEFDSLDPKEKATRNDELRKSHGAGLKYIAYSDPSRPGAEVLRSAWTKLPRTNPVVGGHGEHATTYQVYLQVPDEIPERVRALAHEITRDAPTWYDKATAVEAYLRKELGYTLVMKDPGRDEPIDFFLFERRRGHCEYFSSAMVILLRVVGVPARNVNGFLGGEWNEYGDYIAVRGGDAHSWVEVYFPGYGWVTFDPTPPGSVDQLGRGGTGLVDKLSRLMDTLRLKWFQWVIEYDLHRQLSIFRGLRSAFGGGSKALKEGLASARAWARRHETPLVVAILALAAGIAAMVWRRRRRRAATRTTTTPPPAPRSPLARLYLAVHRRMGKRAFRRGPATTPREYAAALARERVPGAAAFAEMTELYYGAVYGGDRDDERLRRAQTLHASIDHAWKSRRRAA